MPGTGCVPSHGGKEWEVLDTGGLQFRTWRKAGFGIQICGFPCGSGFCSFPILRESFPLPQASFLPAAQRQLLTDILAVKHWDAVGAPSAFSANNL